MTDFDPLSRDPKTFLKYCPKTKADLARHVATVRYVAMSAGDEVMMESAELLMICRDIQRGIDLLDLANDLLRAEPLKSGPSLD